MNQRQRRATPENERRNWELLTVLSFITHYLRIYRATYKLLRFVGAVLLVKSIEKGARSRKYSK